MYVLCVTKSGNLQRLKKFLVLEQMKDFDGKVTAVVGAPDKQFDRTEGNLRVVSHLNAKELQLEIAAAKLIVSRSGYSTIMDLASMGKKAVFVPTPGQTEQEYLAKLFEDRKEHMALSQRKFDLPSAIKKSEEYSGFQPRKFDAFKPAVDAFITSLS